jgi:hypothetical protein
VPARRRLGVEREESEREGIGQSCKDCLGFHPSLMSICYRTRRIREGEGSGRLGWPLGRVGKERKKKEEERKKKWQFQPKFV